MKKVFFAGWFFFVIGLSFLGIAIFAELIGLDKNPVAGWSRPRIAVLVLGIAFILFSFFYNRYKKSIQIILLNIQSRLANIPPVFVIVPVVVAIIFIYAWFASPGKSNEWGVSTTYFDLQARGFLQGNTFLPIAPPAELMSLPNPYDPLARTGLSAPLDFSLYKGRYYLYWGPVPAGILAILYKFFNDKIGDLFLVFCFLSGTLIAQSLALMTIWKRYYQNAPKTLLYISIIVIGLSGPLLLLRHIYGTARVYEAAATGGQLFLMAGMLVLITSSTHIITSNGRLAVIAIFWALAIGTRNTLALPIGLVILILAVQYGKETKWSLQMMLRFVIQLSPLILGMLFLGWYNWNRFDSFTETGLYYQMAGTNLQANYHKLFSHVYILQNIYNYVFYLPAFGGNFPFVHILLGDRTPIASFYSVPEIYAAEPMVGLIYIYPFSVFAILPVITLLWRTKNSFFIQPQQFLNEISLYLVLTFLATFCLLTLFFWVGIRYAWDFLPSLMLLSIIGFWQGYQLFTPKIISGKLYTVLGTIYAIVVVVLNILMALSMHNSIVNLIMRKFPFLP